MELLEFIFSSFWKFIGFLLLLAIVCTWSPITINKKIKINDTKKSKKEENEK